MVNHQSHELGHIANRSRNDSWKDLNDPRKHRLEVDEEGEIWKVTGTADNPKYSLTGRGTRDDRNVELVFSVPPGIVARLEDLPGDLGTTTERFYDCPATPCGGCSAANASSGIRYSRGQAAIDLSVYMLPIVLILGWRRRKSFFKLVRKVQVRINFPSGAASCHSPRGAIRVRSIRLRAPCREPPGS